MTDDVKSPDLPEDGSLIRVTISADKWIYPTTVAELVRKLVSIGIVGPEWELSIPAKDVPLFVSKLPGGLTDEPPALPVVVDVDGREVNVRADIFIPDNNACISNEDTVVHLVRESIISTT